jgi:hypothetical protein
MLGSDLSNPLNYLPNSQIYRNLAHGMFPCRASPTAEVCQRSQSAPRYQRPAGVAATQQSSQCGALLQPAIVLWRSRLGTAEAPQGIIALVFGSSNRPGATCAGELVGNPRRRPLES